MRLPACILEMKRTDLAGLPPTGIIPPVPQMEATLGYYGPKREHPEEPTLQIIMMTLMTASPLTETGIHTDALEIWGLMTIATIP